MANKLKAFQFPEQITETMISALLSEKKTEMRLNPFQLPANYNSIKGLYRDSDNRLCALLQHSEDSSVGDIYPPYQPGDVLFIREPWNLSHFCWDYINHWYTAVAAYKFCNKPEAVNNIAKSMQRYDNMNAWFPAEKMTRNIARVFVRVKNVRVERLKDITIDGILAEGIDVEIPPICKQASDSNFPTDEQRAAWAKMTKEQQDEYVQNLARHTYMGWCSYADDMFNEFARVWNQTPPALADESNRWKSNPFVWVMEIERISKEEALGKSI